MLFFRIVSGSWIAWAQCPSGNRSQRFRQSAPLNETLLLCAHRLFDDQHIAADHVRNLGEEGVATTTIIGELILGKALGWLWDPLGDGYSASDDNPVPTLGVASG